MHVSKRAALGAAAVAAVAFAIPSMADQHSPQGNIGGLDQSYTCNDGYVTWDPTNLWPPNHKFVPIHISYIDSDGDASTTAMPETTSVTVLSVTEQDGDNPPQSTSLPSVNGSGNPHLSDAQPDTDPSNAATTGTDGGDPATFTEDVRAERSGTNGHGADRTYELTVQCMDSPAADANDTDEAGGQTDTVDIPVTVPHDQGVVKP